MSRDITAASRTRLRWATLLGAAVFVAAGAIGTKAVSAAVVASDDANNGYTGGFTSQNLGTGFDAWGATGNGGGTYLETGSSVQGAQSFAIYSGSGAGNNEQLVRPLSTAVSDGSVSLLARHNVDNNTAFTGFDLKSTTTTSFGDGQLLSFGLSPGVGNGAITVTDSTGVHSLAVGTDTELRGASLSYDVTFNTSPNTYELTVTDTSNSQQGTISGSLIGAGLSPVAALGFANYNSGSNQNLIFNQLSVVPEPTSLAMLGLLSAGLLLRRRKTSAV